MATHEASLTDPGDRRRTGTSGVGVGDRIELRTDAVAAGGGCVARHESGQVVFVRHSLPGERVIAEITSATSRYLRADAVEILEAARERRPAPCPHAGPGRCGGCDWQHIEIDHQRLLKAELVREQLRRIAGIEHPVVVEALSAGESGLGCRTRMRFAVDAAGRVGLRRHRSHEIELVDSCPLSTPELAALGIERARWRGAAEVEAFAATEPDDGATVVVVPGRDGVRVGDLPDDIGNAGIVVEGQVIRPPQAVHVHVRDKRFRVSAGAFWQAHASAPEVLTGALLEAVAARRGERIVDLYAGVGLFAVPLAVAVGRGGHVLAVERNRVASGDARRNAANLSQLEVWTRPVDEKLVASLAGSDVIVLDPPREGAGQAVTRALVHLDPTPRRIAYLACDAASFARDLRVALDGGWSLTQLRAFDLFPMTEHVELLATLEPSH